MRISGVIRLSVALALLLSGCATAIRTDFERVAILSEPSGASVLILPYGATIITPARVKLPRDTAVTLFVEKAGYSPTRVYLDREADPEATLFFAGNLLVGGVIGMAVDQDSGALLRLVPNPVEIRLEPEPPSDVD